MKIFSIQKKIVISGLLITVVISTVLYLILNFSIVSSITNLEDSGVNKNMKRIENGLDNYLQYLFQKTGDWAKWDATYDFIDKKYPVESSDYISENLNSETLATLDINLVVYLDKDGEVFFQEAFDSETNELNQIPEGNLEKIVSVKNALNKVSDVDYIDGYLSLDDKPPLLFVAHKILKSDGSGPSNGILIMGRYLDEGVKKMLAGNTLYPVFIQPINDINMPSNLFIAKENLLLNDQSNYIHHTQDNNYGYSLYLDVWGEPAFIARINVPRELVKKYLETVHYSLFTVFAGGLLLSLMAFIFIRKFALRPLQDLHKTVSKISEGHTNSSSIIIKGNDEIAFLSLEIKKMLENLSDAEKDSLRKNEELKKINSFMINRELKMADLKEEIKKLKSND